MPLGLFTPEGAWYPEHLRPGEIAYTNMNIDDIGGQKSAVDG